MKKKAKPQKVELLPVHLYRKIHSQMPIPGIDLILIDDGRILLVKRKREPVNGGWWVPGGRIWKGETFQEAAERIATIEVGLAIRGFGEIIGVHNLLFDADPFGHGNGTHTVSLVMAYRVWPGSVRVLDDNHSESMWWDGRHVPGLHPHVRKIALSAIHVIEGHRNC